MENSELTKDYFKKVGLKVAYYRGVKEMTQEQLSKRSGVSTSVITTLERNRKGKNHEMLAYLLIAEALEVHPRLLFDFD